MWESVVDTLNARFNPENPVCMIPAAQGLAKLYDSIEAGVVPNLSAIEDIFSDNIHLTDIGKYYIACIHFAMIHRTSPVGLSRQLQVWWGGDFDPPSEELALKFQELAWETVNEYSNTCIEQSTNAHILVEGTALSILPNPTHDIFIIEGLLGNYTIQILDSAASVHQTLSNASERIEINIADLPDGLYFIRIENNANNQISIQKILKQG